MQQKSLDLYNAAIYTYIKGQAMIYAILLLFNGFTLGIIFTIRFMEYHLNGKLVFTLKDVVFIVIMLILIVVNLASI